MQCGNAVHRVNYPNIHKHAQMRPHPLWYTYEFAYLQIKTKRKAPHTQTHTPAASVVMQLQKKNNRKKSRDNSDRPRRLLCLTCAQCLVHMQPQINRVLNMH